MSALPNLLSRTIWLSLLVGILTGSCKKDPYEIGLDLLPPSDTLYVDQMDTLTVVAYSELEDSIRSDRMTTIILGSVVDPIFGKTTASFYSQLLLSSEQINFGVNPQLDSLVLILYYAHYYGDTNTLQQLKVFEMSGDIYTDSSYYSNQSAGTYGIELANMTYRPRPTDSLTIWGKKVAPHLRINLSHQSNYLGNKILYAPKNILSSNKEFVGFMKGLHVESVPVSGQGALIGYAASDGLSKLVIYFHNEDNGDSLHFDMPITVSAARFNTFDHHGYLDASPDFKQQLIYHDTTLGRNRLYLQTLGGVKIRLRIPYLRELKNLGDIAINNAVLSLKNPETDTTWGPPPQLFMYKIDTAGRLASVVDELEGKEYYGGVYNKDDRRYWFRLTRHIQRLLTVDTLINYDLCIYASSPLSRAANTNRVLINGTHPFYAPSAGDNLHLKIIYTKLQ